MKTTRITIETERIFMIRGAEQVVGWCPLCNRQGDFILLDDAIDPALAILIQAWRNTGALHISPQESGHSRICLASLLCCFELNANSGIRIAKEAL